MVKKILLGAGVVVLGFVAVVATRPSEYHIERSASVAAAPDVVYSQVNDLATFQSWSPWARLDPEMKTELSSPSAGVGANYHWTGNDQVGEGNMKIIDSTSNGKVVIDLNFLKPMESQALTTFSFEPEAEGTKVTWSMDGKNDFMGKAFTLFMDMDKMVGKDFENGLASLKTVSEAEAKKRAEAAAAAAAQAAAAPATEGAPTDGSAAAPAANPEAAAGVAGQAAPVAGEAPASGAPAGGAPAAH